MSRANAILLVALLVATFGFAQANPGNRPPVQGNSPGVSNDTSQAQVVNNNSSPNAGRKAGSDNNLPQTATILPLLGLVGLSSLVTGFIFRNR